MNIDAIQKKLQDYYRQATPEQVVRELEALGVEFVEIPKISNIQFQLEFPHAFSYELQSWFEDFLVKEGEKGANEPISAVPSKAADSSIGIAPQQDAGNYQYAMAA